MFCVQRVLAVLTLLSTSAMIATAQSAAKPAAQPNAAATNNPVVVELFTSQGCHSCPPADRLLAGLNDIASKHELPIYCLSFHVDYWNSLGWHDPYSSEQSTKRQRQYATAFQSNRVYTPQMIVNGETEFVGSRATDAKRAIQSALASPSTATIQLQTKLTARQIVVEYRIAGHSKSDVLNLTLVQHKATNEVPRGENSGKSLVHVQVVRDFRTLQASSPSGSVSFDLPAGRLANELAVVAYVQSRKSMRIRGAAYVDFK